MFLEYLIFKTVSIMDKLILLGPNSLIDKIVGLQLAARGLCKFSKYHNNNIGVIKYVKIINYKISATSMK